MASARRALAVLGLTLLLPATSVRAHDGWLDQEVARLAALPHTLLDVSNNHWLQVTDVGKTHGVTDDEYRANFPRLGALAAAAQPDLQRELDGILSNLRFDNLRIVATQKPIS